MKLITLWIMDLHWFQVGDYWGYINESGEYVVEPRFDNADYKTYSDLLGV